MNDNNKIEFKASGNKEGSESTHINGKLVTTAWRFVSNGTWFDKDTESELESDHGWMGGLFTGIRTSQGLGELEPEGTTYQDGELCDWTEFDIYDESGILLRKADPYNEKTAGIKYVM